MSLIAYHMGFGLYPLTRRQRHASAHACRARRVNRCNIRRTMRLEGKIAVIVGAGQSPGEGLGNGRATALRFAREGAKVLAIDRDLESAEQTAAMVRAEGGECVAFEADVTDEATLAAAIASTRRPVGTHRHPAQQRRRQHRRRRRAAARDQRGGVRPDLRHQPARNGDGLQARPPGHAPSALGLDHQHLVDRRVGRLPSGRLQGHQGGDDRLHPAAGDPERRVRRPRQRHTAGT